MKPFRDTFKFTLFFTLILAFSSCEKQDPLIDDISIDQPLKATPLVLDQSTIDQINYLHSLIEEIEALLEDGTLNKGQANALIVKIENSIKSLENGNNNAAENQLNAVINQTEAYVETGVLENEIGESIIEAVEDFFDPIESVIYSNLNPDGSLGSNGWSINNIQGFAFSFIPEYNFVLTSVELAIQDISKYYPEPYSPEFFVAIYDDNHYGKPDGLLTAEKGIAPYFPYYERPAYNTLVEFSFPVEIVAGDLYWIAVHPAEIPADLGWSWNSYGTESTCYNSVPATLAGGDWSPKGIMVEGAYQLNGFIIE